MLNHFSNGHIYEAIELRFESNYFDSKVPDVRCTLLDKEISFNILAICWHRNNCVVLEYIKEK